MFSRDPALVRATYSRCGPRASAATMSAGSTSTTWSYSLAPAPAWPR
ncbi:hypothetical protein [Micromonospora sp. NBC_01655]|nr:hypothetical protein [Micromonospora sp. NBC_01655]